MHVSVSKHGEIKQLRDLCLETIDVHEISLIKIKRFTYLKENNLLENKTMKLYLSTLEGNEIRSCKNTMIRCDLNI
jgi:NADPH-dependent 7-cyano-7-deazaguanine reductase QueF-like protein